MKKMAVAASALCAALIATMAMAGDMTVTGTGRVKRQPDTMEISFEVSATDKDKAVARRLYDERTAALAATLRAAEIEKSEVAEDGMAMRRETRWNGDKFVHETIVYKFWNSYTFTAGLDRERLAKINAALFDCEVVEALSVNFRVRDMEPLKNEARVKAVANAREIAQSIADAAGVSLCEIEEIVYGVGNGEGGAVLYGRKMMDAGAASIESATEIRDVEVRDSVRIKWKIK